MKKILLLVGVAIAGQLLSGCVKNDDAVPATTTTTTTQQDTTATDTTNTSSVAWIITDGDTLGAISVEHTDTIK